MKYQIDFSTDGGTTWPPVVKDWTIPRQGHEPEDFWSQSLCWGSADRSPGRTPRRSGSGSATTAARPYARCEAHLVYRAARLDATEVTFDWADDAGPHRASHVFTGAGAARLGDRRPVARSAPAGWSSGRGRRGARPSDPAHQLPAARARVRRRGNIEES